MSADVVWCGCGDGIPVEELKCATCRMTATLDDCGIRHAPIPDPGGIEVRDPDDEIVAHGAFVHVERLDDDRVWLSITTPNGQSVHLDVYAISKRKVGMLVRDEGETPTPIPPAEAPVR